MVEAAKRQDRETVRALLKQGVDVNAPQGNGAPTLHWAVHWDDLATADLLIRAGANVNDATPTKTSVLVFVAHSGVRSDVDVISTQRTPRIARYRTSVCRGRRARTLFSASRVFTRWMMASVRSAPSTGAAKFLNPDAKKTLHFPALGGEAAKFLAQERDIVGVGVDTVSLDLGTAPSPVAHLTLLGAGKYGLELMANLGTVPASGATLIVGGPKHLGATGGPARVFAAM